MTDNAKRLAAEIATTLGSIGIQVSNVLIGRFGIAMDAASEQDASRAVDMLNAQGAMVVCGEAEGEWMVSGDL